MATVMNKMKILSREGKVKVMTINRKWKKKKKLKCQEFGLINSAIFPQSPDHLHNNEKWFQKWKMKVNETKSSYITFTL
jgi:hypothetical protein